MNILLLAHIDYVKQVLITNTGHIFRFRYEEIESVADIMAKQLENDCAEDINQAVRNLVSNFTEIKYTDNHNKNIKLAEEYIANINDIV